MENPCPSCGADPGAGKFCQHCGTALAPTCPSCGQEPGSGRFCQHCGTPLDAGDEAEPTATPPASTAPAPPPPAEVPAPSPPAAAPSAPTQQQRTGSRWGIGCLVVALVVIGAVAIGGFFAWQWISDEVLPQVQETAEGIEGATQGLEALEELENLDVVPIDEGPPGPCYDFEVSDGVLEGWTEVSCDGPRDVEVVFASNFRQGPFPGVDSMNDAAMGTCANAFEQYVGVSPDDSEYRVDWLVPTEDLWNAGQRQGICLVASEDGSPLTDAVKGSGS